MAFPHLTSGPVMTLAAVLIALYALVQLGATLNDAGYRPRTPGYARARDGRRFGLLLLAAAALLLAAAWLTPYGAIALT